MTTYTYRVEESNHRASVFMSIFVLMINGRDLTSTPSRDAAIAWCRRKLAKRRKRK